MGVTIFLALITIITIARAIKEKVIITSNVFIPVSILIFVILQMNFYILFIDSGAQSISLWIKIPFYIIFLVIGYLSIILMRN